MVKIHNNKLTIINNTGYTMSFHRDWFDSGRVGDGFKWPPHMGNGSKETIMCYESK